MSVAIRFMAGLAFGFEINSGPGVYLCIYLGIAEIAFFNEDKLED
jgi:hypothetical protein